MDLVVAVGGEHHIVDYIVAVVVVVRNVNFEPYVDVVDAVDFASLLRCVAACRAVVVLESFAVSLVAYQGPSLHSELPSGGSVPGPLSLGMLLCYARNLVVVVGYQPLPLRDA